MFHFFAKIIEVFPDSFGAVKFHHLGPLLSKLGLGVQHHIVEVAGNSEVVNCQIVTAKEFERWFLRQTFVEFLEIFRQMLVENLLDQNLLAFAARKPNRLIQILLLEVALKMHLNAFTSVHKFGILWHELEHVSNIIQDGI